MTASDARFHSTRWSVVRAAGKPEDGAARRRALESLGQAYWYPLYAFARRGGASPEEAEDLVQGFFAEILGRGDLAGVDPERGRFRVWLRVAFQRYRGRAREASRTARRGGGVAPLSLDAAAGEARYRREDSEPLTPERLFERRFARELLARAFAGFAKDVDPRGDDPVFARLRTFLVETDHAHGAIRSAAEELGIGESAARARLKRWRARFRQRLREEVADTLENPAEVDAELDALLGSL